MLNFIHSTGRNNVISGVAKTIRTHFVKHPLAVVNIKGRADGTSVQQLIFELEVCSTQSCWELVLTWKAVHLLPIPSMYSASNWSGSGLKRAKQGDFIQRMGRR